MSDNSAQLQAQLRQLDQELEEGEITQKGYEKRRTMVLSQYLSPEQLHAAGIPTDRAMSMASTGYSEGNTRHNRQTSYGSIQPSIYAQDYSAYGQDNGYGQHQYPPQQQQQLGSVPPARPVTPGSMATGPVQRFQEQQLGMPPRSAQRQPSGPHGAVSTLHPVTPGSRPDSPGSRYSAGSASGTMVNSDYAFNPNDPKNAQQPWSPDAGSRMSTMLDSQQGYFSDFNSNQMQSDDQRMSYGGPQRYSMGEAFSPTAMVPPPLMGDELPNSHIHQLPLEPRDVPFAVYDPHNNSIPMSKFDNIGAVLRHRGKMQARQPAYWVLDSKGKETASITWDKVASRAEKVAQVIRDKSNLYRGDRVALVYRDTEVTEFAIALLGCFIAGVVAVPINNVNDYQKLSLLLTTTQAHLALTTDNNLKAFARDISTQRLKWPTGVEWWKTNEFGSYHPKKKDADTPLQVPDLAYIEFSRAPTGDLRGVVLSHRTIMHQMACLSAILSTIPKSQNTDTFSSNLKAADGSFVVPR